jgi:hypothetical protein
MVKPLIAALSASLLAAACDSPSPVAPTPRPPSTTTPVGQPAEPGPLPIPGTSIVAGVPMKGMVGNSDPRCFPNWDLTGGCRQYDFSAIADGIVRVKLTLEGPSRGLWNAELLFVTPHGVWEYVPSAWPETMGIFSVKSGVTYRILLIGYGAPQAFQLLAEQQP